MTVVVKECLAHKDGGLLMPIKGGTFGEVIMLWNQRVAMIDVNGDGYWIDVENLTQTTLLDEISK